MAPKVHAILKEDLISVAYETLVDVVAKLKTPPSRRFVTYLTVAIKHGFDKFLDRKQPRWIMVSDLLPRRDEDKHDPFNDSSVLDPDGKVAPDDGEFCSPSKWKFDERTPPELVNVIMKGEWVGVQRAGRILQWGTGIQGERIAIGQVTLFSAYDYLCLVRRRFRQMVIGWSPEIEDTWPLHTKHEDETYDRLARCRSIQQFRSIWLKLFGAARPPSDSEIGARLGIDRKTVARHIRKFSENRADSIAQNPQGLALLK
jgi:hypothetical protein